MPIGRCLATIAGAVVLFAGVALVGASDGADPAGAAPPIGAGLMAQEVPPRVERPGFGGTRAPRGPMEDPYGRFSFVWTRAIYSDFSRGGWGRRWGGGSWSVDFPKGDRQFLVVLKRLVRLDAYDWENAISVADERIRRFPIIYVVEPGRMALTEQEVTGLRHFFDNGGFMIVDDFWGPYEWAQFAENIQRVLPDRRIEELTLDDPIFHAYYDITELKQVPNISNARGGYTTTECYGCDPHVRGIRDDEGRLMVVINFNTDLGDAWEWAEQPDYPLEYSTYAYEMGANMIVYGMSR